LGSSKKCYCWHIVRKGEGIGEVQNTPQNTPCHRANAAVNCKVQCATNEAAAVDLKTQFGLCLFALLLSKTFDQENFISIAGPPGPPGPPGKRGKRGKKGDAGDKGEAVS